MNSPTNLYASKATPFWRDERVLQLVTQVVTLLAILLAGGWLIRNMFVALELRGIPPSFSFLNLTSQFDIGQPKGWHIRDDPYWNAFLVGLYNTILVSFIGIILATIWGTVIGIARLSSNYLIAKLAQLYVEAIRGIPLLIFMIFVYQGVFMKFPKVDDSIIAGDWLYINVRGIYTVRGVPTPMFQTYSVILFAGLIAAAGVAWMLIRKRQITGQTPMTGLWTIGTFLAVAFLGWIILPSAPFSPEYPLPEGFNIQGGMRWTPEFCAVGFALVIYTASFVAEIVRGGIMSVSRGQIEAARSLGLSAIDTMRIVVMPQALRVIIPPLTSTWMSLTKNSSLALAVGYPDVVAIAGTVQMQSGRAVEVWFMMVMPVYLTLSLLTSAFGNWYNKRMKIVEL